MVTPLWADRQLCRPFKAAYCSNLFVLLDQSFPDVSGWLETASSLLFASIDPSQDAMHILGRQVDRIVVRAPLGERARSDAGQVLLGDAVIAQTER